MNNSRRWWALGALVVCLLTLGLDGTILNVALPTLAEDLGAGTSQLQWVVDAYILVFAGLLLPLGALGDRLGRRRVLLAGLAVFLVSSLVAAWTTEVGGLIAARAFMGLGSAIMTPMAMATLPVIFPPAERGLLRPPRNQDSRRRERLSRRDLRGAKELGGARISEAHSLQQASEGRPLRGLGAAGVLRLRDAGELQVASLSQEPTRSLCLEPRQISARQSLGEHDERNSQPEPSPRSRRDRRNPHCGTIDEGRRR